MVAPVKGEARIVSPSGDEYTIRLDFNALAEWEGQDVGVDNALEMLQDPSKMNARQLRALIFCGLRQCHPSITIEEAGEMANGDTLNKAFGSMVPSAEGVLGNAPPNRAARRASKAS